MRSVRARVRSLLRTRRYTDHLDSAESVILSLALTIEARDACTEGHCRRLAEYAVALGRQLAPSEADLDALRSGRILHDIGKVGIPDVVLLKHHTVIGERLCGTVGSLERVRPIVRHHHERLDGTGYPDGLRGEAIPLLAQIVGVVDVFDAMTTDRPYRLAATREEACPELEEEAARGCSAINQSFVPQ